MKQLKTAPAAVLFFAAILLLALLNLVTPDRETSEAENRPLQQAPKFTLSSMLDSSERGFAQKYERYLSDQFVGRDGWITLKSICEAAFGKTENNGVAYGRNGHMFGIYRTYDRENYRANVQALAELAAETPALPKTALLVPSGYEILRDDVPAYLGNVDELSVLAETRKTLEAAGWETVDPAPALDGDSYYRTDHHWTTHGAYLAYEAYCAQTGLAPAVPDAALRRESAGFLGTYYNKAKKFDAAADTLVWYDLPVGSVMVNGAPAEGLYDLEKLSTRDQYAMFLHGNNGVTVIENEAGEGSLLVVKDSYANCFVPFLTQNYRTVTVVDLRYLPTGFRDLLAAGDFDRLLVLYNFENLASDENFYRLKY